MIHYKALKGNSRYLYLNKVKKKSAIRDWLDINDRFYRCFLYMSISWSWRKEEVDCLSHYGHQFIMVISEVPGHSHLLPSVWQLICHYQFLRLRFVVAGIPITNRLFARRTLKPTEAPPWLGIGVTYIPNQLCVSVYRTLIVTFITNNNKAFICDFSFLIIQ